MADPFPFSTNQPLPSRIDPCSIVEAIFEIRFTSAHQWSTMPGLLFAQIRDRYGEERSLPLLQVPDELRRQNPALANLPLVQFLGDDFLVQLGPRVVSLVTKPNRYPGWTAITNELAWFLRCVEASGIVAEGERLGVRYIDFFPTNIFPKLVFELTVAGRPIHDEERQITMVFKRNELALRLLVTNSAIVTDSSGEPHSGSIIDMDAWFGALDFELFKNILARFDDAHSTIKSLFFGLLRPEYLRTLKPQY